jgi:hypothetical protein
MLPETDLSIVEKFLLFLANLSEESLLGKIKAILDFIIEPSFPSWFIIFKILSVGVTLFFLWLIYRGVFVSSYFNRGYKWKWDDHRAFRGKKKKTSPGNRRWSSIKQKLDTGKEAEFKLAILEADTLLEETLTKMGYSQDTIEEKIKKVGPEVLSSIDTLITIRQIRNNIVSDPDYKINLDSAKKTIAVYEKAFKEIQLI